MYSPSLLLWEQPHVFTYTTCVPGITLSPLALCLHLRSAYIIIIIIITYYILP